MSVGTDLGAIEEGLVRQVPFSFTSLYMCAIYLGKHTLQTITCCYLYYLFFGHGHKVSQGCRCYWELNAARSLLQTIKYFFPPVPDAALFVPSFYSIAFLCVFLSVPLKFLPSNAITRSLIPAPMHDPQSFLFCSTPFSYFLETILYLSLPKL